MKFLKNTVKQKLKQAKPAVGSWINLPSLEGVEILSQSGFEFLVFDFEHSALSGETIQKMMMVAESSGVFPYVRVAENRPVPIKKALDAGAYGVIVPMVNTKEEALAAAESVYYPPKGRRGVGLSRAQGYGLSFARYVAWYEKNVSLVVQIEHVAAIENLEAILSVKPVDATMIGPYDLSASLGLPGQYHHKKVKEAFTRYVKVSRQCRKPYGFHLVQPEPLALRERLREGYQFLCYGIDELFFAQKCREVSEEVSRVLTAGRKRG